MRNRSRFFLPYRHGSRTDQFRVACDCAGSLQQSHKTALCFCGVPVATGCESDGTKC
jgi:hypothetical protein